MYVCRRQRLWLAYIHGSQIACTDQTQVRSVTLDLFHRMTATYVAIMFIKHFFLSYHGVRIRMCDGQACLLCVCAVKTVKYSMVAMGTTCYEWKGKMVKSIVNWAWFAFILAFLPRQPCISVRLHMHLWLKCMLAFLVVDVQTTANSSDLLATIVSVCVTLYSWKMCSEYLTPDCAKRITAL